MFCLPGHAAQIPSKRAIHSNRLHKCGRHHTTILSRQLCWAHQELEHGQECSNPSSECFLQCLMHMNGSLQHRPARKILAFFRETVKRAQTWNCRQKQNKVSFNFLCKIQSQAKWEKLTCHLPSKQDSPLAFAFGFWKYIHRKHACYSKKQRAKQYFSPMVP